MSKYLKICIFICVAFSSVTLTAQAATPKKPTQEVADTIPLFRGVAVSADLAGAVIRMVSDHGQYEAAARVNLRDKYFPVLEAGYGDGTHDADVVTGIRTSSKGFFGRIGCDYNIMKNKHDDYRIYAGARYGFSSLTTDISNLTFQDPVYGGIAGFSVEGQNSTYHWLEAAFTMDAKIAGPLRAGWSVRYRRKLASTGVTTGQLWYVPGYGTDGGAKWNGMFYVTLEL